MSAPSPPHQPSSPQAKSMLPLNWSSNCIYCSHQTSSPAMILFLRMRPEQKWLILILLTFFGEFRQFWQIVVCAMQSLGPSLVSSLLGDQVYPNLLFRPSLFQSMADFSPIYIQFPGELYFNCFGGIWRLHRVHQRLTWLARHLVARLGLPSNHARLELPRLDLPSN